MPCAAHRIVRPTKERLRKSLIVGSVGLALGALPISLPFDSLAHDDPSGRIGEISQQIEHAPHDASLLLERGRLHRLDGHYEAAIRDFRLASEYGDGAGEADYQLGLTLQLAGRPAEAIPHLDRFIAAHPDGWDARAARARSLAELGYHLAAAADFSRVIALSPLPDHYLERARALAAAGRTAEAVEGLDSGLERLGAVVSLQRLAIELDVDRNNIDGALARIDRMAGIAGRTDIWLARRGDILLQAGRRDEAHAAYGQALAAIETLPAHRQGSSAVRDLKSRLEAALQGPETPERSIQ